LAARAARTARGRGLGRHAIRRRGERPREPLGRRAAWLHAGRCRVGSRAVCIGKAALRMVFSRDLQHRFRQESWAEGGAKVRRLLAALALVSLVAGGTAAWAQPSLAGPTGLLRIPTADALGALQWNAGASNVWADGAPDESYVYANVGLLPKLEIGATRQEFEEEEAETVLNAKYRLLGLPGRITLAGGVIDITDQLDRSAYAVVSHELGAGIVSPQGQFTMPVLHVGVGGGRFDGLFGGLSVVVGGKADVMAEYDGQAFNVGARWPLIPKVSVTAASLDGFDDFALGVAARSPW